MKQEKNLYEQHINILKELRILNGKFYLLEEFVKQENSIIKKRIDVIWKNIHQIMATTNEHLHTFDAHKEPITLPETKLEE